MTLHLTQFTAAVVFAICASVVFAITQRDTPRAMVHYGFYCLAWFLGGVIACGWIMHFIKR
jgi:hypothetical protein